MIKDNNLHIYNTLTRKKEKFEPVVEGAVGMYVCGPTVYGDPHLGHARSAIVFDLVFRYFKHLGYKVRYVRNITDVGHLEHDADEGEDKIAKKARLEQLEPMEVAQYYTNRYHKAMDMLNVLPPSIEPHASGHIPEQIEMTKKILENGFAYEVNGSVYFDVEKYNSKYHYGKLSGRKLDELYSTTRENLAKQEEKRNPFDFALWKKADERHIMRWKSEWSDGFPGWHIECSVMSTKYLGEKFDIHGGGMDLMFPHHECEIAQNVASTGEETVKYWMHNNLITIEGQKMSKSLGNFITLFEFFNGDHPKLDKAYEPITIRFFILSAHYRSTLDFSLEGLKAAEKNLQRIFKALFTLNKIQPSDTSEINADEWEKKFYAALDDDFNTPVMLAHLYELIKDINKAHQKQLKIDSSNLEKLKKLYNTIIFEILGLTIPEEFTNSKSELTAELIDLILTIRKELKANKMYELADMIRNKLTEKGIIVRDTKDGFEWEFKN